MIRFISEINKLTKTVSVEGVHEFIYFLGESIWIQTGMKILYQIVKCCWIIPKINIVTEMFLNGLK